VEQRGSPGTFLFVKYRPPDSTTFIAGIGPPGLKDGYSPISVDSNIGCGKRVVTSVGGGEYVVP